MTGLVLGLILIGILLIVLPHGWLSRAWRAGRAGGAHPGRAAGPAPADQAPGLDGGRPAGAPAEARLAPGPEIDSPLFSGGAPETPAPLADADRLSLSVGGLRDSAPQLSAARTLTSRQRRGLLAAAVFAAVCYLVLGHNAVILLIAAIIVVYLAALGLRLVLFRIALTSPDTLEITDAEARAAPDGRLPVYTVLVPAFNEPEVMARLIANLRRLEYPADRLDIKLLLEEDDRPTVAAAQELVGPGDEAIEIVLIPPGDPRTKPKALNYGLSLARGQVVTIYDAEDRPDPLQLRKAAVALGRLPPDVACLQAKLAFFNPQQNMITRWFFVEYRMWFSQMLPALVHLDAPVPLGGTSNHFRREVLADIGGWDPFNVTEDADLGVRLHRRGYRTGVLESTTLEEANSDFVNWVKQRSRWYKGYLQTWLVHMRHPGQLRRDLGWQGFALFNLFVGGTPVLAMLNPVFWLMTVLWFVSRSPLILSLFPMPVYYGGLLCWLAGNFVFVYATVLSAYETGEPRVVLAAVLTPVYWVMMSVAATKAALQILLTPSYWEKTQHGLDLVAGAAGIGRPEVSSGP